MSDYFDDLLKITGNEYGSKVSDGVEAGDIHACRKIIAAQLFLNTVEEGGETEFLYQNKRLPPVQGTLALYPAGYTHTHRGNPPLKGNKYIMTTWLEFVE